MSVDTAAKESTATPVEGVRFTVASRPQRRYAASPSVSNLNGSTSFAPIQLPATGYVRKLSLLFTVNATCASAGTLVAGDAPFNLISGITLTDATGQPIMQPVSGYNLYLINKWLPAGGVKSNLPRAYGDPQFGPEYNHAATATTYTATFRLDLDLEQDCNTGYTCIPNLDSNASLQLKIDVAPITVAFSGTSMSAANVSVRVTQHYWAPVGGTIGGQPVSTSPVGLGDYVETRYETQTVTPASENTIQVSNRGGLIKGIIIVSRAAGARTAFGAGTSVGLVLDNNPIDEGVPFEEHMDMMRRMYGYMGPDKTTSYAPLTAGVLPGADRGVLPYNFSGLSGGRDSWLATRVGSLLQFKVTPGAGASQIEIITQIGQIKNPGTFYAGSALD